MVPRFRLLIASLGAYLLPTPAGRAGRLKGLVRDLPPAPAHTGLFVPRAEPLGAVVPHRGQWLQSGSSDILQAGQVLGAVAVMVEGASGLGGSSSPASATPFLNSFIDF